MNDTAEDKMKIIDARIASTTAWLHENAPYCFADQNHLDEETPERAYWHYGYLVGLKDVRQLLHRPIKEDKEDKKATSGAKRVIGVYLFVILSTLFTAIFSPPLAILVFVFDCTLGALILGYFMQKDDP